ncbi:hypothetical protein N8J89_16765 [Crossiella sp. CA-258035]|uniref:hypothetical protein n=1 Tax=Crossiella sp. CA-258035 TaxID=2981138 RepID=UPI0024BCBD70|nr:hypothetical protein [Crossiella sp. CA-258035]WHT22650.1 hypothetical protein N8J89_16765 [Crossiella sp. CA-258035]
MIERNPTVYSRIWHATRTDRDPCAHQLGLSAGHRRLFLRLWCTVRHEYLLDTPWSTSDSAG